jgi:3-oxoacyl-[acyl-carrier-protein] synthase-1
MPIQPLSLTSYTLINALGAGVATSLDALRQGDSGLRPYDFDRAPLDTWIGRVEGIEDSPVLDTLREFDCRNNRLAQMGLRQDGFEDRVRNAVNQYGASRVGLFLGTSTSGIQETEKAYANKKHSMASLPATFDYVHTHNPFSVTDFCSRYLGLNGPAVTISTACSSSAKVFATAYRHITSGLCDAAVVGGIDSLCLTTLYGFNALELLSNKPCCPWGPQRNGINIGEAAGFALLEKYDSSHTMPALLGYGESSDAWHMSTPHPEGEGSSLAMLRALDSAGIKAADINYINLHGTSTPSNDASEDKGLYRTFGIGVPCSSTKGWTGHTLGAAGITEAIFSCLAIEHSFLPSCLNTSETDPNLTAAIVLETRAQKINVAMSNSFGFGGSNCSLIFGRVEK